MQKEPWTVSRTWLFFYQLERRPGIEMSENRTSESSWGMRPSREGTCGKRLRPSLRRTPERRPRRSCPPSTGFSKETETRDAYRVVRQRESGLRGGSGGQLHGKAVRRGHETGRAQRGRRSLDAFRLPRVVSAGFVVVVADDPGPHSSQTEQDSRFFAHFAKIPVLGSCQAPRQAKELARNGL